MPGCWGAAVSARRERWRRSKQQRLGTHLPRAAGREDREKSFLSHYCGQVTEPPERLIPERPGFSLPSCSGVGGHRDLALTSSTRDPSQLLQQHLGYPGSSSSVPARYLTAPACGSRGNYSRRSGKTNVKPTWPRNPLAPPCPLHADWWVFSCARLRGTRRGIRQKAWLRLFLSNSLCPTRENQPYYSISKYIEKEGQGSKWSVTFAQLGRNKSQACTVCYTQQICAQRLFFGRLKGKGFPGYLTCYSIAKSAEIIYS
ncbi:uncharacterized protein LOC128783706 [Vidua chalybeata]|uniref:uncharacterized protein LOC128783706 n=1 Tax=Vidua chalybeata TaxID=81927 RepID=UPI0023A9058A|nr:uncharacterized protein LOC128783706 [Vidua chalybeata]